MRRWLPALIVLLLTGALAAQQQNTRDMTVQLLPGALSISARGVLRFTVTSTGSAQDVTAVSAPTFRIVDARGSGAGWHVTFSGIHVPVLGERGGAVDSAAIRFTPAGSGLTVISGSNTGIRLATSGELTLTGPVPAISADRGSGQGTYEYSPPPSSFHLHVPADIPPGDYSTTLTATIFSGP
ncbi:MAG: WxL domain-containing protein [Candidatus Xenobia bacterium]